MVADMEENKLAHMVSDMMASTVAHMEVDKVADMVADIEVDMVVYKEVDMVADTMADIEEYKLAEMEVDKVADMVVDMEVNIVADMVADMEVAEIEGERWLTWRWVLGSHGLSVQTARNSKRGLNGVEIKLSFNNSFPWGRCTVIFLGKFCGLTERLARPFVLNPDKVHKSDAGSALFSGPFHQILVNHAVERHKMPRGLKTFFEVQNQFLCQK